MTLNTNLNLSNLLYQSSLQKKVQILIDNEIDIMLNNEMSIKKSEFEMLDDSLKTREDIFAYQRYDGCIKIIMELMLIIENNINNCELLINSILHFKILSNLRKTFTKSMTKISEQLDEDDSLADSSYDKIGDSLIEFTQSMMTNGLMLVNFDKDSDFNIDNLKNNALKKVKDNIGDIENMLERIEKIKQRFEFKLPSVDKKVNYIRARIEEFLITLEN